MRQLRDVVTIFRMWIHQLKAEDMPDVIGLMKCGCVNVFMPKIDGEVNILSGSSVVVLVGSSSIYYHHRLERGRGVSVWVWFLWFLSRPSFVPIDPMLKFIPLSEGKSCKQAARYPLTRAPYSLSRENKGRTGKISNWNARPHSNPWCIPLKHSQCLFGLYVYGYKTNHHIFTPILYSFLQLSITFYNILLNVMNHKYHKVFCLSMGFRCSENI